MPHHCWLTLTDWLAVASLVMRQTQQSHGEKDQRYVTSDPVLFDVWVCEKKWFRAIKPNLDYQTSFLTCMPLEIFPFTKKQTNLTLDKSISQDTSSFINGFCCQYNDLNWYAMQILWHYGQNPISPYMLKCQLHSLMALRYLLGFDFSMR